MMRCYAITRLEPCGDCRGYFPRGATKCPHCAKRTLTKKLCAVGATLGAGSIAFTLMACYGAPPCPDGSRECYKHPTPSSEGDGGGGATDHADGGK